MTIHVCLLWDHRNLNENTKHAQSHNRSSPVFLSLIKSTYSQRHLNDLTKHDYFPSLGLSKPPHSGPVSCPFGKAIKPYKRSPIYAYSQLNRFRHLIGEREHAQFAFGFPVHTNICSNLDLAIPKKKPTNIIIIIGNSTWTPHIAKLVVLPSNHDFNRTFAVTLAIMFGIF